MNNGEKIMSEQEKKLTIEDKLKESLNGDTLKNALDFVAYLREIGMTTLDDKDGNRFYYKGELMCIIIFWKDDANPSGLWIICDAPVSGHEGFPTDESLEEFARANVKICGVFDGSHPCGCGSEPGKSITVFGKDYDNVCTSELQFYSPDTETLEKVKKLMELWIYKIDNIAGYSSQDR